MDDAEREAARSSWADATAQLAGFLYEQQFRDPQLAKNLTLLELPNLLAGLEHLPRTADAARVVAMATGIENLL
jgi:hypothetical protein